MFQQPADSFWSGRWHKAVLLLLFASAFLARLYQINELPRDFWTLRQYACALIARAMYFDDNPAIPESRRAVMAHASKWIVEPPILEYVSAGVFRVLGAEQFWVPRSITVLAWVAGGWFLYLVTKRLIRPDAALVAAGYYLFLPFGVTTSRSWQPDSLMMFGLMASVCATLLYFEKPGRGRFAAAALVSAAALLFKPGPNFFCLSGVFFMFSLAYRGWYRTWTSGALWGFGAITLLPATLVNVWAFHAGLYQPGVTLAAYLSPELLFSWYFWKGWMGLLIRVLTLPGMILGALGLLLLRDRRAWALIAGVGGGYLLQSLLCTFTTPNHDYWHLHTIPLVAMGLAGLSVPVWNELAKRTSAGMRVAVFVLGLAWLALGLERAPWLRDTGSRVEDYAALANEIGDRVGHSSNVIMLDYDFGASLRYFAEINGWYWPETQVIDHMTLAGMGQGVFDPTLSAKERFQKFYADKNADYFVICRAMRDLDRQNGLHDFLTSNFSVVTQSDRFVVFDLRRTGK